MNRLHGYIAASVPLVVLLNACAPTTPRWDSGFGNAVRASVAAQVIDPAAVRNTTPPAGIDGRAAVAAQQRYQLSFGTPSHAEPPMTTGASK